jgi:hypothetical protein
MRESVKGRENLEVRRDGDTSVSGLSKGRRERGGAPLFFTNLFAMPVMA